MQLIITVPDTLPDALQATPAEFEREARMAMAVKLFERKRISSGVAANLVGIEPNRTFTPMEQTTNAQRD